MRTRSWLVASLVVAALLGGLATLVLWPPDKNGAAVAGDPKFFAGFLEQAGGGGGSGDITSVVAGAGLAGGCTSGDCEIRALEPNDGWYCYDELVSTPATTGGCFIALTATSGTVTPNSTNIDDSHPGVYRLLATDIASRAGILSPASASTSVVIGANVNLVFETMVFLGQLSDGTNTFIDRFGFIDSVTGEPVDAVMFRYNQASSTAMQCVVRANNVETSVNSSFTVAASAWTKLRIEVDGVTAVHFYVNGSEVCAATAVTNLPIGNTRGTGYGINRLQSAGTADTTLDVDYVKARGKFVSTLR